MDLDLVQKHKKKVTYENRASLLKNKCGPQTINSRKFVIQKNGGYFS